MTVRNFYDDRKSTLYLGSYQDSARGFAKNRFSDGRCDTVCIWKNDNFLVMGWNKNLFEAVLRVWLPDYQIIVAQITGT